MTEKEYFAQIKDIRKHISAGRLEYADGLLAKLYSYKPVRLLWFVAKAEYVLKKEGDPEKALKVLDGDHYLERRYFLGEDYPGLKACIKFRVNTFRQMGRERDAIREEYCYQRTCGKRGSRQEKALAEAVEAFAADSENVQSLQALGEAFYHTADMVSYLIVHQALLRRGALPEDRRDEQFHQLLNSGYLEERICAAEPQTFILVMDGYLGQELEVLGFLLHSLGHKVYLLSPPLAFETEEQLELGDTLAVSLENAEQYPDLCVIPPVALTRGGETYGDNRDHIIDHICRKESGTDQAVLLCSGKLLDSFYRDGPLRGRLGRMSAYETDFQEEKLQFGWAGSYLSYISNIYGYDVRPDIEAKPEVDFSILIPVRNSARTLRYTLETCLNQRYTGSYEIVVSDNSVEGNTEVQDLCRELNDPKIRYVKTPYSLPLTKSFEFGFLQTRGEFIFAVGADDGVLPWALESLKWVLGRFPREEVVQWDRGFYAWPGFNGGQENMFQVPRAYEKGKIAVYFDKTKDILGWVSDNQQAIYVMPLLYINSGFRRSYLKTMLRKTGKLLDGCNQDVQTGIINCCIQKEILKIAYPITIAGMSPSSIGYLENNVEDTEGQKANRKARQVVFQWVNKGIWVPEERSRRLPQIGVDVCGVYFVLSKAVQEGLMTDEEAEKILSWRDTAQRTCQALSVMRGEYDRCIHTLRFAAKKLGELEWLEEAGQRKALLPRYIDEEVLKQRIAQKSYQEGPDAAGGETLDASKFGVRNIAEAVELFERRMEAK